MAEINEELERPAEPEEVRESRHVLKQALEAVDTGMVMSVSIYMDRVDNTYTVIQSQTSNRLEQAGALLKLACSRLGFVRRGEDS